MKFCVQKGLGGAALNKQTAGNVSVYSHLHCLPVVRTPENALEIKGLRFLEVCPHSGQPAR